MDKNNLEEINKEQVEEISRRIGDEVSRILNQAAEDANKFLSAYGLNIKIGYEVSANSDTLSTQKE